MIKRNVIPYKGKQLVFEVKCTELMPGGFEKPWDCSIKDFWLAVSLAEDLTIDTVIER